MIHYKKRDKGLRGTFRQDEVLKAEKVFARQREQVKMGR